MELLNTLGIGRRMDVGGQKYGGTCLCQWNGVAVQRYAGRPDVSVPAERSGCSAVCGETGRVRVSGTGWQPGGIGLSGLGQRCGELIANCD